MKEKKTIGSATFTDGVHSTRLQASLRTDFEGTIGLTWMSRKGRSNVLSESYRRGFEHDTVWFHFKITKEGILIGGEDYAEGCP